jgi:SAM-dependent methyltransferase
VKLRKPTDSSIPFSDLDMSRWKEYEEIWTDSLWIIPQRARGNGHALEYHGNFVPQIATQTFRRFSKAGEVVLDMFLGSGTSAVEALRLGRRCVGVELKPELVEHLREKLGEQPDRLALVCGDSGRAETVDRVRSALAAWDRSDVDLLVLHPPYADIIRFSEHPDCLSNAEEFLPAFRRVAEQGYGLLRPGRFAVLVIGDKYEGGELVPLGFQCMQAMNEAGFRTKSIVVKNIEGNEVGKGRDANLWRYRALKGGFYIFKHEYVILFEKPASRGKSKKRSPDGGA